MTVVAAVLSRINNSLVKIENAFGMLFGFNKRFPPEAFCLAGIEVCKEKRTTPFSLKDLVGDGFLWAVPKHRTSIEKRMKRKFGHPKYVLKILTPKTTIRVCNSCGDHHEIGILCPTCYKKVMDETKEMQATIQDELGLTPVEKEVVVVYENEKNSLPESFEGKQIVEMKKPRPSWFSKNLLQQTTQQPATTKDVKPYGLS